MKSRVPWFVHCLLWYKTIDKKHWQILGFGLLRDGLMNEVYSHNSGDLQLLLLLDFRVGNKKSVSFMQKD